MVRVPAGSASTDAPCRPANRSEAALPVKGKAYGATIPPAPAPRGRRAARQEVGARRSGSAFWLISCRSFLTARRSDSALWLISCRSFLTARRSAAPRLPEAGVVPAEGDQLVVGALLDHGALRHHQDPVGDLRLREPVGDDDRGAPPGHLERGALEHAGTGGALVGRGLVEDQHGRVPQRDPGQGQLLGLLGGEALTLLAHLRVQPAGE